MFCTATWAQWGLLLYPLWTWTKYSCLLIPPAPSLAEKFIFLVLNRYFWGWAFMTSWNGKQLSLICDCRLSWMAKALAIPSHTTGLFLIWIASLIQCSAQLHKPHGWHKWGKNCSVGLVVTNISGFLKLVMPSCNPCHQTGAWGEQQGVKTMKNKGVKQKCALFCTRWISAEEVQFRNLFQVDVTELESVLISC